MGQLPGASAYLKAFDIFVLPSLKEGFPWAVLEAMAASLPVIATSVGAVPEIIVSGQNGIIIQSRNPKALAEAIRSLSSDVTKRHSLGSEGHKTVASKFSLVKMVSEIEALL